MDILQIYTELHKQLGRKQRNPLGELLFFTWTYLSAEERYKLPDEISIRAWINKYYYEPTETLELIKVFKQVEQRVPQLHSVLSELFEITFRGVQEQVSKEQELYASVFRRFPYQEMRTTKEWLQLYWMILDDLIKKHRYLDTDPQDLCRLAAAIFSSWTDTKLATTKSSRNEVYLPSIKTGNLAVAVNQLSPGKYKYVGWASQVEAYCITVINLLFHEIDSSGIVPGNNSQMRQWNYALAFLPPAYEDGEVSELLNEIIFKAKKAVIIVSHGFLFAQKYTLLRRKLLSESSLTSVINLGSSSLSNTRVKLAMLVFDSAVTDNRIMFLNGEAVASPSKRTVKYDDEQIVNMSRMVRERLEIETISKLFDKSELSTDEYSLVVSKKIPTVETSDSVKTIKRRIERNQQDLAGYEIHLQGFFNKLLKGKASMD